METKKWIIIKWDGFLMRVAVVGAGGAGLASGRHCLAENLRVDIFEQTGNVGGTWYYTDRVGVDENGLPVHSSMYQGLRTNLPKEVMSFEDFPYPSEIEPSYIDQEQVFRYMQAYAEKYRILEHIKFFKHVINIDYLDSGGWSVEIEDVKTKMRETLRYDSVIVCNGHYRVPNCPSIEGLDKFEGEYGHSHDYRSPKGYDNKRVLIIGSGPSGLDISKQIAAVAKKVFVNHRSREILPLPLEIVQKGTPIRKIQGGKVLFQDGTEEAIDKILFCTGYQYSYPFLSDSCKILVTPENCVHPLYKHVVNIERPTMGFIGVPFKICPFPLFDIQARFFLSTLTGHFELPSREEMYENLEKEWKEKEAIPKRLFHEIGEIQGEYFDDLATTANIAKMKPVISKLFLRVRMKRDLADCFKIINDDDFVQIR